MGKGRSEKNVYWCPNCNVPLLSRTCDKCGSEGGYCASDLKPVFEGERKMYENFFSIELPYDIFISRNRIILDGETLFRWKMDPENLAFYSMDSIEEAKSKIEAHDSLTKSYFRNKIEKCNRSVLEEKEKEAINFIKKVSEEYSDRFKVISYSGGKDSSVVAILVRKALGNVPLFFSDTTLEFPETYEYIKNFAEKYGFELITDEDGNFYSSEKDFFELCKELGPPSMQYRWCCTVFKKEPVNEFNKTLNEGSLTFDGIRKSESSSRKDYSRISEIDKIPKQLATYPILDWSDAEVWFYTLYYENIDYNPLYEYGYTRVGCWTCPNASPSNTLLKKIHHNELWSKFEKILKKYAEDHDKSENWITEHYWRLRRPKTQSEEEPIGSSYKVCQSEPAFQYDLKEPITSEILEHFKPFGKVKIDSIEGGKNYFQVEAKNSFKVSGIESKINVDFTAESPKEEKEFFEQILKRAINCIDCGGCIGSCPTGALTIKDGRFTIDSEKCTRCKNCLKSDCIALKFKRNQKSVK